MSPFAVLYFYLYNAFACFLYYRLAVTSWKILLCIKNFGLSKIWKVDIKKKFGSWAVVTGCTDGIGKAYTFELAKRGINIILISRSLKKLEEVAADVRSRFAVETETIQIDFSSRADVYPELQKRLQNRTIGILVNNVGVSYNTVKPFNEVTDEEIWQHQAVNIGAMTSMTKIIVPAMMKAGKGAIVNMSSITACKPHPYLAVYSASKAYNSFFSACLGYELKNLTVQALTPYFITTKMVSTERVLSKPSLAFPSPETFAASAILTLGYTDNTCGYIIHELVKTIYVENLPESIVMWITALGCKAYCGFRGKKKS